MEKDIMMVRDVTSSMKKYVEKMPPEYLFGRDMQDYLVNSLYDDEWCSWEFPQGMEGEIEDNQLYLVWYESADSSDPSSFSEKQVVTYIERAPKTVQATYEGFLYAKEKLRDYLHERRKEVSR